MNALPTPAYGTPAPEPARPSLRLVSTADVQENEHPALSTPESLRAFVEAGGVIVGVDVDTQKDFVDNDGALFVAAGQEVRANLQKLNDALNIKIGSADSHAFDAWEFQENGGPFPRHCVKGERGWLKIPETSNPKTRFVPMSQGHLTVGEAIAGEGNRAYGPKQFANEVVDQGVSGIFEKEVYSMFANPNAGEFIRAIVEKIESDRGITRDQILFAVYGYCTGGYCADAAAEGLRNEGYNTAIVEDATAPLNIGHSGQEQDGAAVTRAKAEKNNIHLVKTTDLLQAI